MGTRASRCAIWKLHATPSREADINPNSQKGGYPAPDRVTFLTGPNRDFPKRRRHPLATSGHWLKNQRQLSTTNSIADARRLSAQSGPKAACQHTLLYDAAGRL
jgi:hypothetical protein